MSEFLVISSDGEHHHFAIREKDFSLVKDPDNWIGPWAWWWNSGWQGPNKLQVWFKWVADAPKISPVRPSSLSLPDPIEPPDLDEYKGSTYPTKAQLAKNS